MPRRKAKPQEAKPQEVQEVTPAEVKQEERLQEVKPVEAASQELSPPQPSEAKLVIKEVEPAPAPEPTPEPTAPIVRSATWEEFERFAPEQPARRSWVKEVIEQARMGPVKVENLTKGQIAALVNYIARYNKSSNNPKIAYKYDVKKGVVLLAPVVKSK